MLCTEQVIGYSRGQQPISGVVPNLCLNVIQCANMILCADMQCADIIYRHTHSHTHTYMPASRH